MQNVKAIKKYGQNFLTNKTILKNIADIVNVGSNDLIIEIGPGMGALTEYLKAKNSMLLCYEIDKRMAIYLEKFKGDKVNIIFDDFMKRDLNKDLTSYHYENIFVIANIPYYITSPIILKLIQSNIPFKNIVLLVQKEFAERLVANVGSKEYNAFTLYVDYYYQAKLQFLVSRENFAPSPKVDSAVILLERKKIEPVINESGYFKFIKVAFQNKRKTLKNNLKDYDWSKIVALLQSMNYTENVRAEEISRDDFKKLWNLYNS